MAPRKQIQAEAGSFTNVKKISDDLWIALRSAQKLGTWYLYKIGNKFPQRSLGTTDRMKATQLALNAYHAYQEDPNGNWLGNTEVKKHNKDFKATAEEWLAEQACDYVNKEAVIRKFLIPFFHDNQKITSMGQIDAAMVERYKRWRRAFWLTDEGTALADAECKSNIRISDKQMENYCEAPSPNTLNREYPTLRQILKYAHMKGYMVGTAPPVVPGEDAKANPRPAFLGDDFDILMGETKRWAAESANDHERDRRQLLCDWIYIVRWTGLRVPHEAAKLCWSDVRLDINILHVHPETKTGAREVPFDQKVGDRLKAMKARRMAYAKEHQQEFSISEPVFALPCGKPYRKFGGLFNAVVERCQFPPRADDMPYSPYSLRHTYATFALAEGRSYEWLEEVMGTSMGMLKDHYKSGTIEQTRRYLESKGLLPGSIRAHQNGERLTLISSNTINGAVDQNLVLASSIKR